VNPGSCLIKMANIASQKKRILRTAREQAENRRLTSAVKTHFHRLERAVAENDRGAIEAEHRSLVSRIDKAVQKGALHPRNAARRKSRAAKLAASS
jgi:small subunit ribosomal protein S20